MDVRDTSIEELAAKVVAALPPLPEASQKMLSGHLSRASRNEMHMLN